MSLNLKMFLVKNGHTTKYDSLSEKKERMKSNPIGKAKHSNMCLGLPIHHSNSLHLIQRSKVQDG